jgi:hypothetical protein
MTSAQLQHVELQRSPGDGRSHAIKNHRVCYSMPAWMRDGFASEAHADLALWGAAACRYYASDEGNPRANRAQRALKLLKQHNP